ncbi:MAG: exodeoxyribonuclease VII large subunit [bacterium]|nr:exodeoxyribonuclease VII large subunit [bacterium]
MESLLQPIKTFSVTGLTNLISDLIDESLGYIWLEGEVSNLRIPSSGHYYFTLKDDNSQIRAVMFKTQKRSIPFEIQNGQKLLCLGSVSVYKPRGEYQIILEDARPSGMGSLHLAFEQLKERLEKEGLFDERQKRAIPEFPKKIGVVTSATGAAIKDILNVIERRNVGVDIVIAPAAVQGEKAAQEISKGIELLNEAGDVDVIIAGRGGGSIEDLWPFNEEVVARAIHASKVPVVSAVGHERDLSISDLVADLRASTPTAAAEILTKGQADLSKDIYALTERLILAARSNLNQLRSRLATFTASLKDPAGKLVEVRIRLDDLMQRLEKRAAEKIILLRSELKGAAGKLEALSPLSVLARGYSIATLMPTGEIINDKDSVEIGDMISLRLKKGGLECRVEKKI